MHRLSLLFFLGLFCCALFLSAASPQAAPLLQEGKKTLYQRVISHPTAVLHAEPGEQSKVVNKGLRPFTPLYVYERSGDWLNVGRDTRRAEGWIPAGKTTAWNQSLTLLFADRSERDPVLFFREMETLKDLCATGSISRQMEEFKAAAGRGTDDPRIVAIEPENSSVDQNRFYIMPILDTKELYEEIKFLRVASIDPGSIAKKMQGIGTGAAGGKPRTGIAIVMDTTISMGPYISQSRALIKKIFDRLEKTDVSEHVGFAFVAFRNSTAAVPGLEYTAEVISDFVTAKNRKALESSLAKVREASVSSHSFNEDSLSGIYNAVERLNWQDYDSRLILLLTDAGPLPGDDRYRSVSLAPQELNDFAAQKGIWIVAAHIRTQAGRENIEYAQKAYGELTRKDGSYYPIQAKTYEQGVRQFADVTDKLAKTMEETVTKTARGELQTRPSEEKASTPEEAADQLAQRIGYAMQLRYLGRVNRTQVPQVVDSWIADKDPVQLSRGRHVPSVEVAVLLTKTQLNDMYQTIATVIDNAERTKKTDSRDFFQGILSASVRAARDPNLPTQGKTLSQLGVLDEFLEGLPYKSDLMMLTEDAWYRKSIGEQTEIINRLKSKLARYEEYDRDRHNWESFGMHSASDWVYRIPLSMLP